MYTSLLISPDPPPRPPSPTLYFWALLSHTVATPTHNTLRPLPFLGVRISLPLTYMNTQMLFKRRRIPFDAKPFTYKISQQGCGMPASHEPT